MGSTSRRKRTCAGSRIPYGNHVARIAFRRDTRVETLEIQVELALEIRPINPFDFLLDKIAETVPFPYSPELRDALAPFLVRQTAQFEEGPRFRELHAALPATGPTAQLLTALNREVNRRVRYVIREEPGVWTPEETLAEGRGSCRDSAVLLVALLRARGLAARFVSGYLVQLTDEGMIPDEPRGVGRDVVDLHAWAEVFLPGAGWIGLDATSGLLCGEGHIPLACTAQPGPGRADRGHRATWPPPRSPSTMTVGRLGHEPRPTAPFTEATSGRSCSPPATAPTRGSTRPGFALTMRRRADLQLARARRAPRSGTATRSGPTKWTPGAAARATSCAAGWCPAPRCSPAGQALSRGEPAALGAGARRPRATAQPLWTRRSRGPHRAAAATSRTRSRLARDARAHASACPIGVLPAFEDPWRFLRTRRALPVDVDPLKADLDDPEERRRLARVLGRGLGREVGYVLPLAARGPVGERAAGRSAAATCSCSRATAPSACACRCARCARGDRPRAGRAGGRSRPIPGDPRRAERSRLRRPRARSRRSGRSQRPSTGDPHRALRRAPRRGASRLPPAARHGRGLLRPRGRGRRRPRRDRARRAARGLPAAAVAAPAPLLGHARPRRARGEPPAGGQRCASTRPLLETVVRRRAARRAAREKYLLDGRMAGSGGGNHLTLGGPTPLESPFLRAARSAGEPDHLRPAPPVALVHLHRALRRPDLAGAARRRGAPRRALRAGDRARAARSTAADEPLRPGSRTCCSATCSSTSPATPTAPSSASTSCSTGGPPHGRQGLRRAARLRDAAASAHGGGADDARAQPGGRLRPRAVPRALVRWGPALHDRFLLPYWMWRDFEDVLAILAERAAWRCPPRPTGPFLELRCPVAGRIEAGDVALEVRNALEPWHVLGEEVTAAGTSRYVDSSMERIEVRAEGLVAGAPPGAGQRPRAAAAAHRRRRASAWAACASAPGPRRTACTRTSASTTRCASTWSTPGASARSAPARTTSGTPRAARYDAPPLTRFEAAARRAQRFTLEAPLPWPVTPPPARPHPDAPLHARPAAATRGDHPLPAPRGRGGRRAGAAGS